MLASERAEWRATLRTGIAEAEEDRIEHLIGKRKCRADPARLLTYRVTKKKWGIRIWYIK